MKKIFCIGVLSLAVASAAMAVPSLGFQETWDTPGDIEGWQLDNGPLGYGIGLTATALATAGYVEIEWADNAFPQAALFYAGAAASGGAFNGDTTGVEYWTFRLQAMDNQAGALAVYFSNPGETRVWSYSLAPAAVSAGQSTYQLSAAAFGLGGWTLLYGNPVEETLANFNLDRSALNWIGVYIADNTSLGGQERYRLDNFGTAVPEPEAVSLLLIAALSLGITFRSRLSSLLGRMR